MQDSEQHLRHQNMKLSNRQHGNEAARNGQIHLLTELRDREQAHQEALSRVSPDVEAFRNARLSEARLREEVYVHANTQGESCDKIEESTFNQLMQQMQELQVVVNSMLEAQDFKLS